MGTLSIITITIVGLAAFVGDRIINLRNLALSDRELTQKYLPNCHLIKGIDFGAEDITVLKDRLAFVSTGLKYPGLPSYSEDPGKILTLTFLGSELKTEALIIIRDFDKDSFNPHGISLFTDDEDGAVYLFVVNHPYGKSQVEIFRFLENKNALKHIKSIRHDLLHSVNDIVAVSPESFYATNDHYFSKESLKSVEMFLALPWCQIVYYSPETVQVVAGGLVSANGINISPDKRHLYISDILKHLIVVLEIQKSTVLANRREVDVGSLCDNIEVDNVTGDLWMGCHPNGFKFLAGDPNDPPGSEVIRVEGILSENPRVTRVYSDDGSVIIGSSVATTLRGKLLIGTVYQKALICDLN